MIYSSENGGNRVFSVSWPRIIGQSIFYGIAAAGLGAALGWGILLGHQLAVSVSRGNMRLTDDPSGNASVLGIILLTLMALMPVCVILGAITTLLLRRAAWRGRLSTLRAAATGGIVGVGAVALAACYDIVQAWLTGFPQEWDSRLVICTYLGAIALGVGAGYGWRMGRWLTKQVASGGSVGAGASGSQQET